MEDPYVYEKTSVLKNKFDVREKEQLARIETSITSTRMADIDKLLKLNSKVDYDYLKEIHKYLFERVYSWAGEERTIDMYKSENVLSGESVDYGHYTDISTQGKEIVKKMDEIEWNKFSPDDQADKFSKLITKLWQVHPFREGNTRTTMTFAAHYALSKGFSMDRTLLSENSVFTRAAMTIATIGDEYSDKIKKIFRDSIVLGDKDYFKNQIEKAGFNPTPDLIKDMREVNRFYGKNISIKEIKELYVKMDHLPVEEKDLIAKVGNDFKDQELQKNKVHKRDIVPEP